MTRAYDQAENASTDTPPARWRLVLLAWAVLLVGGAALVAALALGVADPPCMRASVVDVDAAAWSDNVHEDDSTYYGATAMLSPAPFTLALRRGSTDAAWGIWIDTTDARFAALVTGDGYLSVDDGGTWREFPHIRREVNTLCLAVRREESTLYVNNEVAWRGAIRVGSGEWGYVEGE